MGQAWGQQIREIRREKGMTVSALAAQLGVSPPTVRDWESGATRHLSARHRPAVEALGVDTSRLAPPRSRTVDPSVEESAIHPWAAALTRARLSRGLSQRDAAPSLGVSVSTLSKWERGGVRQPAPESVDRLVAWGVPRDLLGAAPDEHGPHPDRPTRRSECPEPDADGERRCPWLSCRHHLGVLRVGRGGRIYLQPEGSALQYACLWDVLEARAADKVRPGGAHPHHMALETIGRVVGVTRERVRQIEEAALAKIREAFPWFAEHLAASAGRGRKRGSKSRVGRAA